MVWYSHLFKSFPVCCDPHRGFSVVNETEVDVFLESPCFFYEPTDVKIVFCVCVCMRVRLLLFRGESMGDTLNAQI